MKTRLKLENLIFARAAFLRVCVWGKNGAFCCSSTDALLRCCMELYNRFFAEENRTSYAEPAEYFWFDYFENTHFYRGGLVPFQVVECEFLLQKKINLLTKK